MDPKVLLAGGDNRLLILFRQKSIKSIVIELTE